MKVMMIISITLVVIFFSFLGLSFLSYCKGFGKLEKIFDKLSSISAILLIASFIFIGIGAFAMCMQEWEYDKEPWYSEKIVALNDNNLINKRGASRYSRLSYINEELYYQYMEELKNGGYQVDKVEASITTVYYDNDNPRVDWYKRRKKWLFFENSEPFYKMYVPEGSIIEEFNIDLQ